MTNEQAKQTTLNTLTFTGNFTSEVMRRVFAEVIDLFIANQQKEANDAEQIQA